MKKNFLLRIDEEIFDKVKDMGLENEIVAYYDKENKRIILKKD